jgi:PAS domain S-box-containing protein
MVHVHKGMMVVINHIEEQGMAHSLVVQLRQIIPSLNEDNLQWRKVDELLEMAFYQTQIDRHLLQDSVNRLREQLQVIGFLQNDFVSATDVQTLVLHVCDLIPKHTEAERAVLFLYDEERDVLISGDVPNGYTTDPSILLDVKTFSSALSRKCLQKRLPLAVNNLANSEYIAAAGDTLIKSALALPVIEKQKIIGVLQVYYIRRLHVFTQDEIDLFQSVARILAAKIENIRFFSDQKKTQEILNKSEESYYQIYEDIPVGLFRSKPDGTFLRLNPALVHILGYPDRETLLRTNAIKLYGNPQERVEWQVMVETYNLERESELRLRRYDGTDVWVQRSSRVTRGLDGNVLYYDGAIVDVSGRKRAEVQIREAMKEKEVLLKEIHHRVKNNLQIVSSLLNLQSVYLRDAYDRELFKQSQNRVKAMALLHEKLYRSAELTRIDFDEYLNTLMPSLFQSYKTSSSVIECSIEGSDVMLDIDTAIPCGLIVSELVANSLKHAFPEERSGRIGVALVRLDQGTLRLTVYDNGIGMDQNTPSETAGAPMGWELVRTLTEQLSGSIEIDRQPGTRVCITFKEKVQKEGRQRQW